MHNIKLLFFVFVLECNNNNNNNNNSYNRYLLDVDAERIHSRDTGCRASVQKSHCGN